MFDREDIDPYLEYLSAFISTVGNQPVSQNSGHQVAQAQGARALGCRDGKHAIAVQTREEFEKELVRLIPMGDERRTVAGAEPQKHGGRRG